MVFVLADKPSSAKPIISSIWRKKKIKCLNIQLVYSINISDVWWVGFVGGWLCECDCVSVFVHVFCKVYCTGNCPPLCFQIMAWLALLHLTLSFEDGDIDMTILSSLGCDCHSMSNVLLHGKHTVRSGNLTSSLLLKSTSQLLTFYIQQQSYFVGTAFSCILFRPVAGRQ